jgi:phosphoserine aminotransferase
VLRECASRAEVVLVCGGLGPTADDLTAQAAADSMLNTPPTFGIYLLGKILAWVQSQGGLAGMAKRNEEKASALYSFIDGSGYYSNPVEPGSRSRMNVPFLQANPELDKQFVAEADEPGEHGERDADTAADGQAGEGQP